MSPLLLFPDFALIALGFGLRRLWLPAPAWVTIEKLVYFVLFPCLLFHSVVKSQFDPQHAGWFSLGSVFILSVSFLAGWLIRLNSKMGRIDFAAGLQTAYRFNSYIGLALASRLGGQEYVAKLAILLALGVPLANVFAVSSMSKGGRWRALLEIIKNPLIIGTTLGLIVKISGVSVPEPLTLTLERLASAAVSLGLLAVGSGLVFSGLRGHWVESLWWLAIKLLLAPLLAVVFARMTGLNHAESMVLLVFASIPSASSAYILAARMGGNSALVACLISLSTVAAAGTIPLMFELVHRWALLA